MTIHKKYRGRFAPSPTGPLHFGSLVAAMGSYLQAKSQGGDWLIRIDDIDPPREAEGASENILRTLEAYGFEWDEKERYQSHNHKRYGEAVAALISKKLAYPCSCSRASILNATGQEKGSAIYPGLCRNGPLTKSDSYNIRLCCFDHVIEFTDAIQGKYRVDLIKETGDFILQRRDHYFSYHLATGIDDAEQGITEVVRGTDLVDCTPAQIEVQHALNLPSPDYCHLPVVKNNLGQKLSKQNHAKPILATESVMQLIKALKFLGQMPPHELNSASQNEIWLWALTNWNIELVSKEFSQIYE